MRLPQRRGTDYAGDVLHVLRAGAPAEVYCSNAVRVAERAVVVLGISQRRIEYAHDRLTINGGLRYDRFRLFLLRGDISNRTIQRDATHVCAGGSPTTVWNAVSPRIGASFDPVGNGRTPSSSPVMASTGCRPMRTLRSTRIPTRPSGGSATSGWTATSVVVAARRGGAGASGASRRYRARISRRGSEACLRMREATAHVERDLGAVNLSTGVIWRAERQQGLRQLSDRSFEMFTVSTILHDPGPEGTTLAPDADGTAIQVFDVPTISLVPPMPVVGNVARSNSDYTTWEVTAARLHRPLVSCREKRSAHVESRPRLRLPRPSRAHKRIRRDAQRPDQHGRRRSSCVS